MSTDPAVCDFSTQGHPALIGVILHCPSSRIRLQVYRKLHNSLLDRPHYKFGFIVNSQFPHEIKLVGVYGFGADPKHARSRADGLTLSQQFEHFAFAAGKTTFLRQRRVAGKPFPFPVDRHFMNVKPGLIHSISTCAIVFCPSLVSQSMVCQSMVCQSMVFRGMAGPRLPHSSLHHGDKLFGRSLRRNIVRRGPRRIALPSAVPIFR
jgi:hypothetical protein